MLFNLKFSLKYQLIKLKISWSVWRENQQVRKAFNLDGIYKEEANKISLNEVYTEYVWRYLLYIFAVSSISVLLYFGVDYFFKSRAFIAVPHINSEKLGKTALIVSRDSLIKELPAKEILKKETLRFKNLSGNPYPEVIDLLIADKYNKKLHVYSRTRGKWKRVLSFDVVLGRKRGPKRKEGDLKTPVGNYWINEVAEGPAVGPYYGSVILKLNFPNSEDTAAGISGSGIWIHGSETGKFSEPTRGCLKLRNDDIVKLTSNIRFPAPVIILPETETEFPGIKLDISWVMEEYGSHVRDFNSAPDQKDISQVLISARQFLDEEKNKKQERKSDTLLPGEIKEITLRILKWRETWSSQDINLYSANFHAEFTGREGRNMEEFMTRKKNIFGNQDSIDVDIGELEISPDEDLSVKVEFDQNYTAFQNGRVSLKSQSRKQLWLKKESNDWLIIKE